MGYAWTVRDSSGVVLDDIACTSRLELGRKLVPGHYDPFRLEVSSSYRAMFNRALSQVLKREGWSIVRTRVGGKPKPGTGA